MCYITGFYLNKYNKLICFSDYIYLMFACFPVSPEDSVSLFRKIKDCLIFAGLAQINTRLGYDASWGDAYRQGVSGSLAQSSMRILDRFLNRLPTVTIREGHRVTVYLTADLDVPVPDDRASAPRAALR